MYEYLDIKRNYSCNHKLKLSSDMNIRFYFVINQDNGATY